MRSFVATTADQLGPLLRGFRRQRGMTQQQLAAGLGLAQKAISETESHSGRIGVKRLFQLLSALEVELVLSDKRAPKGSKIEW